MAKQDKPIINVGVSQNDVKTLGQLRKELLGLNRGTEEYNKVLQQAVSLKSQNNKVNNDLRNSTLNLTDVYRQASNVAAGVTAGFTALTSVSALLGQKNEVLAETLVKVNAGLQLTQAFTAVSNGFKSLITLIPKARMAFAAFNATVAANPILIVVTALAALAAGIVYFTSVSEDNTDQIERANKIYDEYDTIINKLNKSTNTYIRDLKRQGAAESVIIAARIESQQELARTSLDTIRQLFGDDRRYQAFIDNLDYYLEQGEEVTFAHLRGIDKSVQEQIRSLFLQYQTQTTNLKELLEEFNETVLDEDAATNKERERERERFLYAEKKALQDQANTRVQIAEDARKRELAALNPEQRIDALENEIQLERIRLGLYQEVLDNANSTEQQRAEALREQRTIINNIVDLEQQQLSAQNEYLANLDEINRKANEGIQQQIELQRELNSILYGQETPLDSDVAFQAEIERLNALAENTKLTYQERIDAAKELKKVEQDYENYREVQRKNLEAINNSLYQSTATTLRASASILGETTVAGKAVQVAAATIDTLRAGTSAFAATPGGPIVKGLALAATLTTGFKTVKDILKTKVPGVSDTVSTTVDDTVSLPSFPQYLTPIQETETYLSARDEEFFNQSQRVYVTENDISNVQNRVNVAEIESRF